MIKTLTNDELVHHVDNKPSATELEKELADRLYEAVKDILRMQAQLHNYEDDML